jgi:hypothetical protein
MEAAALVGFCVWLRNIVQPEMSALVRYHGGFANPLTATFEK